MGFVRAAMDDRVVGADICHLVVHFPGPGMVYLAQDCSFMRAPKWIASSGFAQNTDLILNCARKSGRTFCNFSIYSKKLDGPQTLQFQGMQGHRRTQHYVVMYKPCTSITLSVHAARSDAGAIAVHCTNLGGETVASLTVENSAGIDAPAEWLRAAIAEQLKLPNDCFLTLILADGQLVLDRPARMTEILGLAISEICRP